MTDFFERITNWLFGNQEPEPDQSGARKMLQDLFTAVEGTQEIEYDCEEVYELLDQYVEMVTRGEDAEALMPLVKHHLEMCVACREEYQALLRILEETAAGN